MIRETKAKKIKVNWDLIVKIFIVFGIVFLFTFENIYDVYKTRQQKKILENETKDFFENLSVVIMKQDDYEWIIINNKSNEEYRNFFVIRENDSIFFSFIDKIEAKGHIKIFMIKNDLGQSTKYYLSINQVKKEIKTEK